MVRELMRKPYLPEVDNIPKVPDIKAPLPRDECRITFDIKINGKEIILNEEEALIVLQKLEKLFKK